MLVVVVIIIIIIIIQLSEQELTDVGGIAVEVAHSY